MTCSAPPCPTPDLCELMGCTALVQRRFGGALPAAAPPPAPPPAPDPDPVSRLSLPERFMVRAHDALERLARPKPREVPMSDTLPPLSQGAAEAIVAAVTTAPAPDPAPSLTLAPPAPSQVPAQAPGVAVLAGASRLVLQRTVNGGWILQGFHPDGTMGDVGVETTVSGLAALVAAWAMPR